MLIEGNSSRPNSRRQAPDSRASFQKEVAAIARASHFFQSAELRAIHPKDSDRLLRLAAQALATAEALAPLGRRL